MVNHEGELRVSILSIGQGLRTLAYVFRPFSAQACIAIFLIVLTSCVPTTSPMPTSTPQLTPTNTPPSSESDQETSKSRKKILETEEVTVEYPEDLETRRERIRNDCVLDRRK